MKVAVIPLVVASALFMENLDSTVLSTALPTIARDLGTDPVHLKLALTSYLLSLAVFIPASGWAADRFGARRVFIAAMAVFTLGSILCGMATSLSGLVAARIVQGLGGAMMTPVGRLIVLRSLPKSELVGALAWLTVPGLMGPLMGPLVGGFVVTVTSWQWIFWINVPVAIVGGIAAWRLLPDLREEASGPFDSRGFVLSGLALTCTVSAATLAGVDVVGIGTVIALAGVGAGLLAAYVWHARHTVRPILDLALLARPTFRVSILGGTFFRIGVGASPFLLPLLFQLGFGFDPLTSGALTFATGAGAILMKFAAQPILDALGFRRTLILNGLITAVLVAVPVLFTPATPAAIVLGVLLIAGLSRSLQFTSVNVIAYAEIESREMSAATSFAAVAQQIGVSLGVSVAALALEISRALRSETTLTTGDFTVAFVVVGVICALSVIGFARLPADAGANIAGAAARASRG